ncbi:MAG: hypothetical protein NVV68_07470 [Dokdonella sp.]|nr:hypothetical protein [Dokdonella sp.]
MNLTDRQREVLDYLRQQIDATGLPPTIHELMDAFGWASPNSGPAGLARAQRAPVRSSHGAE